MDIKFWKKLILKKIYYFVKSSILNLSKCPISKKYIKKTENGFSSPIKMFCRANNEFTRTMIKRGELR